MQRFKPGPPKLTITERKAGALVGFFAGLFFGFMGSLYHIAYYGWKDGDLLAHGTTLLISAAICSLGGFLAGPIY